jgi:hypothetical protein
MATNYGFLICPLDIGAYWCVLPLDENGMRCAIEKASRLRLCGSMDCSDLEHGTSFQRIGEAMMAVAPDSAYIATEGRNEGSVVEIQHWIAGLLTMMPSTQATTPR